MKIEPKAFASLSSGLLARKGAARPAMKPQGFGQMGGGSLEDLGWNDMGFEPPKPSVVSIRDDDHDAFGDEVGEQPLRNPVSALTPVHSPVHSQQAEIADRLDAPQNDDSEEEYDDTAEPYEPEAEETAELYEPEPEESAEIYEAEAEETAEVYEPQAEEFGEAFGVEVPERAVLAVRSAPVRPAPSAVKPRSALGAKAKAAFTLRLDPDRHLKLRLACAVGGRSAQMLVTDALDALLDSMPELDAMAAKANRKG